MDIRDGWGEFARKLRSAIDAESDLDSNSGGYRAIEMLNNYLQCVVLRQPRYSHVRHGHVVV